MTALTLASASHSRLTLLRNAGLDVTALPARLDEGAIKTALLAEGAKPRDIADALAEAKARKIAAKTPGIVLGCDQILEFDGGIMSKAADRDEALENLRRLSGGKHKLLSAAVAYEDGQPVWRHIGEVTMLMRRLSDDYLRDYLDRQWDTVQGAVGSYHLEGEGARFFTAVRGEYFDVLGLPLLPLLSWLVLRGKLPA